MTKNDPRDVYRLWYEFLLLSDRNKWMPFVRKDFGNIKVGGFDEWWESHYMLFEELDPFTIDVISNVDEFLWYIAPLSEKEQKNISEFNSRKNSDRAVSSEEYEADILVVAVNRLASRTDLIDAFTELLKSEGIGKPRGRAPYEKYNATYSLFRQPDVVYLKTVLDVYKLKSMTNLTNVEIEEKLKLNTRDGRWFSENEKNPKVKQYKHNQQNTVVNRYLEVAQSIIENVSLGEFPAYEEITYGENGNARNSFMRKKADNEVH